MRPLLAPRAFLAPRPAPRPALQTGLSPGRALASSVPWKERHAFDFRYCNSIATTVVCMSSNQQKTSAKGASGANSST
ncbi:hypothetical protein EVAR_70040_1 [Eumeta japonica]|uniref:Uncharacterized protein n=1 Tax=Eumeta variegata TaxID=151549 RepID=A0A4C2A7R2_EUMVA|nr:hypothetical protein EVAR_70040_1 [Eumeta japonica]